ncbi:MAG: hypothetical protein KAQ90_00905 [Melioribacteraceae bacterium]|nr:hypothetical protein [Melioribacteraceae bacterium]
MADANNIQAVKIELEELVKSINSKVDSYIQALKLKSSDEILSGSISEAQKMLNQIVPIEEGYRQLSGCHDIFLEVLNGNYTINESEVKAGKTYSKSENSKEGDDSESLNYTSDKMYRVPILKALIYLGGSANLDEVAEFIKKEMKNKFKPADLEKGKNGFDKLWIEMIHTQKVEMVNEGLVTEDKNEKVWEIVQQGIDYLAKYSK